MKHHTSLYTELLRRTVFTVLITICAWQVLFLLSLLGYLCLCSFVRRMHILRGGLGLLNSGISVMNGHRSSHG